MTVAGVGVASITMDSQAASEISHEIHGSYGPAFLGNIRLLGWDHPNFLVTNQTHVYHLNVIRRGDTGAHPFSDIVRFVSSRPTSFSYPFCDLQSKIKVCSSIIKHKLNQSLRH
jgi:hypothetical protein